MVDIMFRCRDMFGPKKLFFAPQPLGVNARGLKSNFSNGSHK